MYRRSVRKLSVFTRIMAAVALSLLIISATSRGVPQATAAASCNSIDDCTNQIIASNNAVSQLKDQATSYQDAISRLQSETGILQNSITDNQNQQASLQADIDADNQKITAEKAVLGDDLKTMYIDGQETTIEELATSDSLSQYVDKEEYRTAVQDSIQNMLQQIANLQVQQQSQKDQVSSLLAQQQSQESQLVDSQTQQSQMLSYDQSQQASYNAQTAQNQVKLNALIAAQRADNNASSGGYYFLRFPGKIIPDNPSVNNYPYAGSGFSMSTAPGCNNNDGPDPWGYCTRQCVSYAAWAVQRSGRTAPKFYGDAKNWVAEARSHGIPIYSTPQVGDVAISTAGTWGHAMYVEAVSGNQIYVSQYNQQLTGQYSTQWRTYR